MSSQLQLISAFELIQKEYPDVVMVHNYSAKADILLEDDDDNDVYLIREGKAAVLLSGGSEILLGAGDLIGELSFLLGNKRTASIVAKENVICWSIHVEDMEKVFIEKPLLSAQFYKALGQIIAERLVNGARRQAQNLVFQEEGDPLIGVMRRQIMDLRQRFDNLVRIVIRELTERTKQYSEELQDINREYGLSKDRSLRSLRNEKITIVMNQVQQLQGEILKQYRVKMENIFSDLGVLLAEMLDLEKRNEVGLIAHQVFSSSLISSVELWKKRNEKNSAQIEPLLLIAHILQERESSFPVMWDFQVLVAEWIDDVLRALPTIQAFRTRINLLSGKMLENIDDGYKITVLNDVAGVVLAKIYPKVASVSGKIYAVAHDASSLYYMDLGMDIRSGRVKVNFHRVKSILSLIVGDSTILPPNVALGSQNIIAIDGLVDYLPDRYLVRLVEKCIPYLTEGGAVYLSGLLPSSDQALLSGFFQWHTIRRTPKETQNIFQALDLRNEITAMNGAIVIRVWKE